MSTPIEIPADPKELRLLLIDDEPAILASFALAFGDQGWDVTTAESGEDGLAAYEPGAFDLVITDKNLPGVSGVEVVSQIRQLDAVVTIMMLTGFGSASSAVDTLNAGVDAYVEKPVRDVIRLTASAETIIKKRQKQQEVAARGVPLDPFEVLILTQNKENAHLVSADLAGKVDRIAVASTHAEARLALAERRFGLVLVEGYLTNLCDTIEEIRQESPYLKVAVLCQNLGLDAIMRLVEVGVAACIVLPVGSPPFANRLTELVNNLRQEEALCPASQTSAAAVSA